MEKTKRFETYRHSEARTAVGQLVQFTCRPDEAGRVKQFLEEHIRSISSPTTNKTVNVSHGGYGQYTRYQVVQHRYVGGGPGEGGAWGYREILEITDAPDGRCPIVINESSSDNGSYFTEWETLEKASTAFDAYWSSRETSKEFAQLPGFKRLVICGALTPWFYAIGDQQLLGDYAFPEGLTDDPVYRLGQRFIVFDNNNVPALKICMGTRYINKKRDGYPHEEYQTRLVSWDDGSIWNEALARGDRPRPAAANELWIAQAIQEFQESLTGKQTEFTIQFTDGTKFVGKVVQTKHREPCAEGDYFVVVSFKDKTKPREGWVNDFKPTPETPDIVQYVTQRCTEHGLQVAHIQIKERKTKKGGKKWAGVFFCPNR